MGYCEEPENEEGIHAVMKDMRLEGNQHHAYYDMYLTSEPLNAPVLGFSQYLDFLRNVKTTS